MPSFSIALFMLLTVTPTVAFSQPPFIFNGLHVDLTLTEAVARAEQLGGHCEASRSNRSQGEGASIQCTYDSCAEREGAEGCDTAGLSAGPKVAAQTIVSIGLEAQDEASPVDRIMILHEGDTEALAASLLAEFGPTDMEGAPTGNSSWSHARRWSWTHGPYRMGLLNSPKLILLAVDRVKQSPDEQPVTAVVP